MKYSKYFALASALILMGAGCAAKPDTVLEEQGGLNPVETTSTMPAGTDAEVDEMMVGGDAMMDEEKMEADGEAMMEGDVKVDADAMMDDGAMMESSNHVVTYDGRAYSVSNLSISVGDTVTWNNESTKSFWPASNVHPTHQILPELDALKPLGAGSEYSFTFTKAGSWSWHDHLHPNLGGTITVQ